jgi:hypothetical protein
MATYRLRDDEKATVEELAMDLARSWDRPVVIQIWAAETDAEPSRTMVAEISSHPPGKMPQ